MLMRPLRVIIWAVSRSRSTALERCVMEHPAVHVLHERLSEPFLRQHWPDKYQSVLDTRRKARSIEVVATYAQALETLAHGALPAGKSVLLSKEIAWFCDFDHISDDWLQQFKHVFLVRHPEAVMQSLYRVGTQGEDTWFDPDESGFDELQALYWRVHAACPADSMLTLESDKDLLQDSHGSLSRLCAFMGVPFIEGMLQWQAQEVPAWQFFRGWHEQAQRSTCFAAVQHAETAYPAVVTARAADVQPTYRFFALLAAQQRQAGAADVLSRLHHEPEAQIHILLLHSRTEDISHMLWSIAQFTAASCYALDTAAFTAPSAANVSEQLGELACEPLLLACSEAIYAEHPALATPTGLLAPQAGLVGLLTETGFHLLVPHGRHGPSPLPPIQACMQQQQRLRERSLDDWATFNHYNQSAAPVPDWLDSFMSAVQTHPDHLAVSDGQNCLTLQQLHDQALRLAVVLQARLAAGAWAVLFKRKNVNTAVAMTACALAGRPYLELPNWYCAPHCQQLLDRLGECLVLCDNEAARQLPTGQPRLLEADFARQADECLPWVPTRPAIAYGLLTSGTSGPAKVALMSPSAMLDSLGLWQTWLQPGQRIGFNAWLTGYLHYPLLSQCTTVIIADEVVLDPHRLMDFIADNNLQQIMITPSLLQGLVREDIRFVACGSGLRVLWSSGENLSAALRSRVQALLPNCRLIDLYGSNEAGDVALKQDDGTLQLVKGVQALVLDRQGQAVPCGGAGHLRVRTPGLFDGYLGQSSNSQAADGGLFDTGDRVVWLGHGRLRLLGRDSAHLKIRGYKVHPENIEQVLNAHPMVAQTYVGSRHEGAARQLLAYIVPADSAQIPTATALRAWARLHLPFFAVPSAYYTVPALEAGHNQKRAPLSAGRLGQAVALPEGDARLTGVQGRVSAVWRAVLGDDIPALHEDDDFFDRGGSLQLSELLLELNRAFDIQLSLAVLLDDTRLQGMALAVERAQAGLPAASTLREVAVEAARYTFTPGAQRGADPVQAYRAKPSKRILLTGATGFFGAFILAALARLPEVEQVVCLLRAKDMTAARRRCLSNLQHHGLVPPGTSLEWLGKLQVECGDLAAEHLGLSPAAYQGLVETIDCVVHAGAEVNWIKPYASLKACNVEGTQQIIQLALNGAMPLLLLSTLAGGGTARTGYEESKRVAEAMALNAAREHGLAVIIIRCGDIAAPLDVEQSPANGNDYMSLMLGSCMLLGCWPADLEGGINLTPVDVAAQVMAQLAGELPAHTLGRTLNLCHPHGALSWQVLCGWVADNLAPGTFEPVTTVRWRQRLDNDTRQHPIIAKTRLILPMILDDLAATQPCNDLEFPRTSPIRLSPQWAARMTRQLLHAVQQAAR